MISYFSDPSNSLLLFGIGSFITFAALLCCGLVARFKTGPPMSDGKLRSSLLDIDLMLRQIVLPCTVFSAIASTVQLFEPSNTSAAISISNSSSSNNGSSTSVKSDASSVGLLFLAACVLAVYEPLLGALILKNAPRPSRRRRQQASPFSQVASASPTTATTIATVTSPSAEITAAAVAAAGIVPVPTKLLSGNVSSPASVSGTTGPANTAAVSTPSLTSEEAGSRAREENEVVETPPSAFAAACSPATIQVVSPETVTATTTAASPSSATALRNVIDSVSPSSSTTLLRQYAHLCISTCPIAIPLVFVIVLQLLQSQAESNLNHAATHQNYRYNNSSNNNNNNNGAMENSSLPSNHSNHSHQTHSQSIASNQKVVFYDFELAKCIIMLMVAVRLVTQRVVLTLLDDTAAPDDSSGGSSRSSDDKNQAYVRENALTLLATIAALICGATGVLKVQKQRGFLTAIIAFLAGTSTTIANVTCALTLACEALEMVSACFWPRPRAAEEAPSQQQQQQQQQDDNDKENDALSQLFFNVNEYMLSIAQLCVRFVLLAGSTIVFSQLPSAGAPPSHFFAFVMFTLSPGVAYSIGLGQLVRIVSSSPLSPSYASSKIAALQGRVAFRTAVASMVCIPWVCWYIL